MGSQLGKMGQVLGQIVANEVFVDSPKRDDNPKCGQGIRIQNTEALSPSKSSKESRITIPKKNGVGGIIGFGRPC